MRVRPLFAWYDFWVGAYWDRMRRRLFFLPLPTLGLVAEFGNAPVLPESVACGCEQCQAEAREAPRTNTRQFCARCNSIDRVGFLAPKDLWRLVAGPRWEHDILCLACFAEIGDEKGIKWNVPELEFYPVSYVTLAVRRAGEA